MKKIIVLLENNSLYFTYKTNQTVREDLMNTNIISNSELIFGEDYIRDNQKIVIPFFQELVAMNKIDTIVFQNSKLASFLLTIFTDCEIKKIRIKKEENVTYTFCEQLVALKNVQELECYSLANFALEYLDKHHIKVVTHSEVFYLSHFMSQNKLNNYAKIYYQKKLKLYQKFTKEDQEDFLDFLKINRYLKIITFFYFDENDLEFILENLKTWQRQNILLEMEVDITKPEQIEFLKKLNKKYKNKKLVIDLVYSKEYLANNLMKQVCLNTLKLCSFLIIVGIISTVGYIFVNNYRSFQEVSTIQDEVANIIENEETNGTDESQTEEGLVIKNTYISSLQQINPDIIGYLKVNNTNIDYPVVTAEDNRYYLKKNLYQEDDINGWIFMDFRNSDKVLNQNTIIYGHNTYYNGVMFGTLHRALNASWYTNPENQIIQFDTMFETMKWQIYSIYTIKKTSDYLQVSFPTAEDKQAYIDLTKNRSIYDFGITVDTDDYILTLSTCTDSNERLVVHAKRISP